MFGQNKNAHDDGSEPSYALLVTCIFTLSTVQLVGLDSEQ